MQDVCETVHTNKIYDPKPQFNDGMDEVPFGEQSYFLDSSCP